MGVQSITERKEVQSGAVSYQTGFKVPDLSSAAAAGPASLGKALSGIGDGLNNFSLALSKIDEADADAITRDIRKFSDHVLNVGYTDPNTGVSEPGIAVDDRIDRVRGSANRHDFLVNQFARQALDGANESVRRLVSARTDEMRSRITHNLKKREVLGEAKFQHANLVQDVQDRAKSLVDLQLMKSRAMRSSPLEEYVAENIVAASAAGKAGEKSTVSRVSEQSGNAAEAFGNDFMEGFGMLRDELESMRSDISNRLVTFCLNEQHDADNKADAMVKKAAADVVDALVKDGDYSRAKVYASQMDEFGFSEEQKGEMVRSVEKAERTELARQEAENEKYRKKARSDAYNRYWESVNKLYKDGEYSPRAVSQLKKELADSIEDSFPDYAAKERAEAHEIDEKLEEAETREINENLVRDIVDQFDAETQELLEAEKLDDINDPERLDGLAKKIRPYNEDYASKLHAQAQAERARRIAESKREEARAGVGQRSVSWKQAESPEQQGVQLAAFVDKQRQIVWRTNELLVGQEKVEYLKSLEGGTLTQQRQARESYDRAVALCMIKGAMDPKKQEGLWAERKRLEKDEIARAVGIFYANWTTTNDGRRLTRENAEQRVRAMKPGEEENNVSRLHKVAQWLEDELGRLETGLYKPEVVKALLDHANKEYAEVSFEQAKGDISENLAMLRKGFVSKAVTRSSIVKGINDGHYALFDGLEPAKLENPYDIYSENATSEEYAKKNLDEREGLAASANKDKEESIDQSKFDLHTVKDGEDLISIAIKYNISPIELMDMNNMVVSDMEKVKPGTTLKVPKKAKSLHSSFH